MIYIVYGIILALASFLQYSFLEFFSWGSLLIPPLVIVVFATIAHKPSISLPIAAWAGFTMDWYSAAPRGTNVIIFVFLWFAMYFLIRRLFTNLSLISGFALTMFAVLFFRVLTFFAYLILNIASNLQASISWMPGDAWKMLVSMLANGVLMGVLFFITNRISRVFNFAFIDKR